MDPLLDIIRLLQPRATLFGAGFDACGQWGLSFRKRDDLLFCWVERGECLLLRDHHAPLTLRQGDFALIFTATPFTLASDVSALAVDSEGAVAATRSDWLALGTGAERPVTLRAGKFQVAATHRDLLASLVPPLVHLESGDASLGRVHALLAMNEHEAREPGPASDFVVERLVELILVEILRTRRMRAGERAAGLLAGLADPVTARALAAIHRDVAHGWTLDELARLCAVSRSAFAARFRAVVGAAPISYLLHWRMALAKDALSRGDRRIDEIAFAIGFQSASAFTTAFTRAVGCSPRRFANRHGRGASGAAARA